MFPLSEVPWVPHTGSGDTCTCLGLDWKKETRPKDLALFEQVIHTVVSKEASPPPRNSMYLQSCIAVVTSICLITDVTSYTDWSLPGVTEALQPDKLSRNIQGGLGSMVDCSLPTNSFTQYFLCATYCFLSHNVAHFFSSYSYSGHLVFPPYGKYTLLTLGQHKSRASQQNSLQVWK